MNVSILKQSLFFLNGIYLSLNMCHVMFNIRYCTYKYIRQAIGILLQMLLISCKRAIRIELLIVTCEN